MRRNLLHGETEKFASELRRILIGIVSVYDTANKESFYHGLMLGLVAMLIGQDDTKSSRTARAAWAAST